MTATRQRIRMSKSKRQETAPAGNINAAFEDGSINECTIRRWYAKFESDDKSPTYETGTERPEIIVDNQALRAMVEQNPGNIVILRQGWLPSGTRVIDDTQHNILSMPSIKRVCILVQNNKVHYEIILMRNLIRAFDAKQHVLINDVITGNYKYFPNLKKISKI
ncbi:hypothetical protein TNCV_3645161 [Trichonephila clavipes]|nr:hypothetical protein TNCV_3645161 [Trichonephila clavipes]